MNGTMHGTMNTLSKISLPAFAACLLTVGCATAGTTSSASVAASPVGALLVEGPAVKAVVAGPKTIHAYSAFDGGAIYTAAAVAGTDSDCRTSADRQPDARELLNADHVVTLDVAAGRVACVETASRGTFELLWHARRAPRHDVVVAHGGAHE